MLCVAIATSSGIAADSSPGKTSTLRIEPPNVSMQKEVQHAIDQGLAWLKGKQAPDGSWSSSDYPAISALVLTAYMGDPSGQYRKNEPEFIQKGYKYLFSCVQPDGGIYRKDLFNYNTSLSIMALLVAGKPEYDPILRRACGYVISQQVDMGEKGKQDTPWDGSIGYGQNPERHGDMSNTFIGLEALYYSSHLKPVERTDSSQELNWDAAIAFIQRCQNLPAYNKEPWASDDPQNKGGFIYCPNHSMAGSVKLPSGKTALRSYGSMSYAGLLSYIYADLKTEDPRVKAVFDWIQRNYSLDENPGLGGDGLYYFYHTMAKALSTYGVSRLVLSDGKTVVWREELARKLFNLQKPEGFWVNENGRWWEKDPVLTTAYAVLALEHIHRGL